MKLVLALLAIAACGDNRTGPDAAPPVDTPPDGDPLASIQGTGLCSDRRCMQISPDAREYEPRFALWADGATKRRWLYLPPGSQIDTSDMSYWVFPIGTKVWKEFARDGVRVETRFIEKLRPESETNPWFYASYLWNATQDGTTLVTMGVEDANGTPHDIPSRMDCRGCHDRLAPSRVLGIDAIQLDYAAPSNLLDLDDLIAADKLTADPPPGSPHFRLPGGAVEEAAYGYLHANCGHCHNPTSDVKDMTTMFVRLETDKLGTVQMTPTHATTVGVDASIPYFEMGTQYTKRVIARDPDNSQVITRLSSMQSIRFMPNLAVDVIDPAGQTVLRAWIDAL